MGRLTADDRSLIWNLCTQKGWGSWREMKEFPNKTWKRRAIDKLIKKIDTEGTTVRKPGNGHKNGLERFIDRTIGQWRRRLECVVQKQGGHIEHMI